MSRPVSHPAKRRAAPTRAFFPGRLTLRLWRERRGVTLVEFGLIAPVLCVLLLGSLDMAHTLYMRATLQGIVQKIARDATLESSLDDTVQAALDAKVSAQVKQLNNNATISFARTYYRSYTDAATGMFEPFTDTNKDGTCDNGEPYEDNNANSTWDKTVDNDNQGGAKDAVLYTVTVTYPRMFPVGKWITGGSTTTVTAATVLRNQPYGDQTETVVRYCS